MQKVDSVSEKYISSVLKKRGKEGHKGEFGTTYIFAGSYDYVGAPYFASEAAVRSGSGITILSTSEDIIDIMKIKLNEVIVKKISLDMDSSKVSSIAVGMGMGCSNATGELLMRILKVKVPVVIDADAINVIAEKLVKPNFNERTSETILTPHMGEFSKLTGIEMEELKENRKEIAEKFARENRIILVLKDSTTLITDGDRTVLNITGNSSMSNGGMGDILAGLIASFISQGYTPFQSCELGSFLLGKTGEKISEEASIVNPRDILEKLPKIIKNLES